MILRTKSSSTTNSLLRSTVIIISILFIFRKTEVRQAVREELGPFEKDFKGGKVAEGYGDRIGCGPKKAKKERILLEAEISYLSLRLH